MSKILILKNDRAGDLFTSLKLISSLLRDAKHARIYLSEMNISFSFFFKKHEIKKIGYDLNFLEKVKVFFDIFSNRYEKIYILSPKSFFFILPFLFRKIKFYGIVYDGKKRKRPDNFLRKYLYKYKIVSRKNINTNSYRQLQEHLIDDNYDLDINYINLEIPCINPNINKLIPNNYIFFQFRYKFFDELDWTKENIFSFLKFLKSKYENVLFCSDIEDNKKSNEYKDIFLNHYSCIDINNNTKLKVHNCNKIFYLKDLNGVDMFHIIKNSSMCLAKEGIVSHICFFHNVKCHNLFNFKIETTDDIKHQKISYSEWCKGMNFSFSLLNKDFSKTINKLKNHIS